MMWLTWSFFFLLNRCQVWKGLMKSSPWQSTSITTKQFSRLLVSLCAQTQSWIIVYVFYSSYFSFFPFNTAWVGMCIMLPENLWSQLLILDTLRIKSRRKMNSIFAQKDVHWKDACWLQMMKPISSPLQPSWESRNQKTCHGSFLQTGARPHKQHRCLLSVAFGKPTENVFSSKVDFYEINRKYKFHYRTRLRC